MSWDDIWKIILCAVGSAGGVGAIIICTVKFASNIIADRLSKKYEAKLQNKLEKHRTALEKKNYITKSQYDAEFSIYRTLSKCFFEAVLVLSSTFSSDYRFNQCFDPKAAIQAKDKFITVATKMQSAQDALYENAAFIPRAIYEKYEQLLDEAASVFWEYKEKMFSEQIKDVIENSDWLNEKSQCVNNLHDKLFALNDELRMYLQSLTIVE